ncbi:hypothetical protein BDV12DRAFT_179647 [Aspergillus spectabilis]
MGCSSIIGTGCRRERCGILSGIGKRAITVPRYQTSLLPIPPAMISLLNKVSTITGASTARLFLQSGSAVLGVDRMPAPCVLRNHSRFRFHRDDPCLEGRAEDIIAACQEGFGAHIDLLLNIPTLSSTASLNPACGGRTGTKLLHKP